MVVSFGVLCSSRPTLSISYVLLITMLLNSFCANHDGVVRLDHCTNDVSSFAALMSKLMYSLLSSLCKCNNSFIHAMMNSDIFSHLFLRGGGVHCINPFYLFSFLFH